jgi:PAS domain-containing protein
LSRNTAPERSQLEQIIAGLTEGVILFEPDQAITYANNAALDMHGVTRLEELGLTVDEYRHNFVLHRQVDMTPGSGYHPIDRVVAGEIVDEVVVVVAHKDNPDLDWTHRIRTLVITDCAGEPDCLVLIIHDASAEVEAEDRFERAVLCSRRHQHPLVRCHLD